MNTTTSVDERIVQMKFDNTNFEKNVQTTMTTLDKLKQALKFDNAKESLQTISDASKAVTFDAMNNAIDGVKVKFSALEIAGITAISRITNSMMDMGTRFIKSVSVDQISTGFSKYAEITSSIQTILAATREQGETMESVTEQMDKLSWFTDETSYSLTDMTNNIAKFTSNGIKLGDATTQMMGVSTAAALAGANVQDASHAMMGLSKAMASGMNRQTWSFIETAHMDTMQFKRSLIEAAAEVGTLKEVGDGLYTTIKGNEVSLINFKDAMKDGWMTKDVMQKALSVYGEFAEKLYTASDATGLTASELLEAIDEFKNGTIDFSNYTDGTAESVEEFKNIMAELSDNEFDLGQRAFRAAQEAKTFQEAIDSVKDAVSSGWMKTFELIFGNYEEAKKLWTTVANTLYDVFAESGNTRNEILAGWKEGFDGVSGRVEFLYGVARVIEALYSPVAAIKEVLDELLPDTDAFAEILFDLTIKFRDFSEKLYPSEKFLKSIQVIFRALWEVGGKFINMLGSLFRLLMPIISGIFSALSPVLDVVVTLFVAFTDVVGAIFDFVAAINDTISGGIGFTSIFETLSWVLQGVASIIIVIIGKAKDLAVAFMQSAVGKIVTVVTNIVTSFVNWARSIDLVRKALLILGAIIAIPILAIAGLGYAIYSLIQYIRNLEIVGKIANNVAIAFEFIRSSVVSAFEKVRAAVISVLNFMGINFTKFINDIRKFKISDLIDKIREKITKLGNTIREFFSHFPSFTKVIDTIKNSFIDLFEKLGLFKDNVEDGALNAFKESIKDSGVEINNLSDAIGYIIDKIKLFMSTIDMSKVLVLVYTITMIRMMNSFMKMADSLTGISGTIKGIGGSIQKFIASWTAKQDSKIMDVAKAIFTMAMALAVVTSLDQSALKSSTIALAALAGVITLMAIAMTFLTKAIGGWKDKKGLNIINGDFLNMLLAFVALSGTLLLVAAALKVMETVKPSLDLLKTVGIIILVITAMAGLSIVLSRFSRGGDIKSALTMVTFAITLVAMGVALQKLADVKWEVITEHTKEIVAVMAAMALIAMAASRIGVFNSLGLFLTVMMLDKLVPHFDTIIKALGGLATQISSWFTRIMDGLQKYRSLVIELGVVFGAMILIGGSAGKGFKRFGTGMLEIALSFIILARGIKNLAALDAETVTRGIKVIRDVYGMFAILGLVLSIGRGGEHALRIAGAIAALSLCLYAISGVIWILGTMNPAKVEQGTAAVAKVLACFALVVLASSIGNGKASFATVLSIVIGLMSVISAMIVLSVLPVERLDKTVQALTIIMAAFAGLIVAYGFAINLILKQYFSFRKVFSFLLGMLSVISIVASVAAAAIIISKYSDATWKEISSVFLGLAAILPIYAFTIKTIASIDNSRFTLKKASAFVVSTLGLIGIASALAIVAGIASTTGVTWDQMLSSMVALDMTILAMIPLIRNISKSTGFKEEKVKQLVRASLAVGVLALSLSAIVFANNKTGGDWKSMLSAMAALNMTIFGLIAIISTISRIPNIDTGKVKNVILASSVIAVIAGSLSILAITNNLSGGTWESMLAMTAAMNAVILSFSVLIAAVSVIPNFDSKKAGNLVLASISIGIIAASLAALSYYNTGDIIDCMIGIDGVILGLIAIITTMSLMKPIDLATIGTTFLSAIAILIPVCASLAILEQFNTGTMVETAIGISVLMGTLTLVLMGLAVVGTFAGPALLGAGVLAVFIIGFSLIMAGLAAVFGEIEHNYGKQILSGLDFIVLIFRKVGEAFGSIVGGFLEGIGNSLSSIARKLTDFAFNILPFSQIMSKIDKKALDGSLVVVGMITAIATGEMVSVLTNLFTLGRGMDSLKKTLKGFAEAVRTYAIIVSGIDADNLEKVASSSKMLIETIKLLGAQVFIDKLTKFIGGAINFDTLGKNLESFGRGVTSFADATSGINVQQFTVACTCTEKLIGLLSELPNSGGLIGDIVGNNDVNQFNEGRLGSFGAGIKAFCDNTKNIDLTAANNAIQVAANLFNLDAPNEGGKLGEYMGENNFEFFNEEKLGAFALGLSKFAQNSNGIDVDSATTAINIASKLFDLDAPNEGGFIADWLGDNTFAQLATELEPFGKAIFAFADSVKDFPDDAIEGANKATRMADILFDSDIHTKLNELLMNQDFWTQAIDEGRLAGMHIILSALADDMSMFLNSFDDITTGRIQVAANCISAFVNLINELEDVKSNSLNGFKKAMERAGDLGINAFLEQFQNAGSSGYLNNVAVAFLQSLANGFTSNESIMQQAVIVLCSQISQEMYNHDLPFKNAGSHIGFIIKVGIEDSTSVVVASAESIINSAVDAAIAKAKERGPELHDAGLHMFDSPTGVSASEQSVAGGMEASKSVVNSSAESVIEGAANAAANKASELGPYMSRIGNGLLGQLFSAFNGGNISIGGAIDTIKNGASTYLANKVNGTMFNMDYFKYFDQSNSPVKMAEDALRGMFETTESGTTTMEEGSEAAETFGEALEGVGKSAGGSAKEIESFGDSIYKSLSSKTGGMSFFNQLELKTGTTAQNILDNMRSNIDGVASWTARLGQLMEKGLHKDMVKTLADAGLDSYDQISAFLEMTDEQIQEANSLFIKAEEGRLYSANTLNNGWVNIGKGNMEGLAKGVADNVKLGDDAVIEAAEEMIETANSKEGFDINSPSHKFEEIGNGVMEGLELGIGLTAGKEVYPTCIKICNQVVKIFEDNLGDSKDGSKSFMVGVNFSVGLARGIKAGAKEVESAAEEVAEIPEKKSKSTMKEKSPSRVAMEIGRFFDLGLVEGIRNNQNEVESASNDLATSALDPLRSAMNNADSYIGRNINLNPVIRPTLDISGISTEASNLSELFNRQQAIRVDAMNNSWMNPDIRSEFLDTFANRIGSEYADRVVDAITNKDMNANVQLEGDAAGVFKLVRQENRAFIRRTGYSGI